MTAQVAAIARRAVAGEVSADSRANTDWRHRGIGIYTSSIKTQPENVSFYGEWGCFAARRGASPLTTKQY